MKNENKNYQDSGFFAPNKVAPLKHDKMKLEIPLRDHDQASGGGREGHGSDVAVQPKDDPIPAVVVDPDSLLSSPGDGSAGAAGGDCAC